LNLAIDPAFPHATGDQLGILGAKIEYEYLIED